MLMAALFTPSCFWLASKLVSKVTDPLEDIAVVGGAVILALLGVATGFIAAIAIKPELSKYKFVMYPIFAILALMGLAYRLWYPFG